jgi:hypothetical protein
MAPKNEIGSTKQGLSRAHMLSIWAAIATALGSQGIPKIVDLLEDKPSVEQVQAIVASQVEKVTTALNQVIAAAKERGEQLRGLEQLAARLEGQLEVLRSECCGRLRPSHRPVSSAAPLVKAPKKDKMLDDVIEPVPEFNVQQQLQVQTP